MKENITRYLRPCLACGEPTPYEDGYCETCEPPVEVKPDPFQPAFKEHHVGQVEQQFQSE